MIDKTMKGREGKKRGVTEGAVQSREETREGKTREDNLEDDPNLYSTSII